MGEIMCYNKPLRKSDGFFVALLCLLTAAKYNDRAAVIYSP